MCDKDADRISYIKSAISENTDVTKSSCLVKALQQPSTLHPGTNNGSDREVVRIGDPQKAASYMRHIPETSLSPYVSYLLTRSIPQSGLATRPDILSDDCTIEWSGVTLPAVITTEDEFFDGVMQLGTLAKCVSAKLLFLNTETQLKVLPEAFNWTASPELFIHCVQLLLMDDPCANITSSLLCCAGLERALGDVYLSASKANQCPSLLRDLLVTKELEDVFGTTVISLLRCLMGHPLGLNLRNVLWHGFVAPSELPKEYAHLLPVLVANLGKRFKKSHTGSGEEGFTTGVPTFKLLPRPYLSLNEDAIALFPAVTESELDVVRDLFSHSYFVLPSMLPLWLAAVKAVEEKRSGDALALLLPCLEHSLRRVFAYVNSCPERAITAEATVLYTTFDEILSAHLPDGSPNRLKEEIGTKKLEMLLDLLVHPEGPKLRAKVSHGEVNFSSVPQTFANHVLCMAVTFCAQYTPQLELTLPAVIARCLCIKEQYVSLFHPISLLKKELLQLVTNLQQWREIPANANESYPANQPDIFADTHCHIFVLHSAYSYLCHAWRQQDDVCLHCLLGACLSLGTPLSPLQDLITHLWERPLNTLYVSRPDLELVGLLRSIVANASQSVCQVTTTAAERFAQLKRMELRARQRSNYDRLISSVATYHQAMVVVLVLVCASVTWLPLDSSRVSSHTRFLKKVLQFSENFNSQTSPAKNRWAEATTLCHTLFTLDFPSSHDQIRQSNYPTKK